MITQEELVTDEREEIEAAESLQELEAKRDGDVDLEKEEPLAEARYLDVVTVLQQILDGKAVDEEKLAALSDLERDALSFFRQVVDGRTRSNEFMFAERRLEGLNQVLAVLQPVLSIGGTHQVLNESLLEVIDGIEELRQKLIGLEDAEEEIIAEPQEKAVEGDKDDEDEGDEPSDGELADEKRIRKNAAQRAAAEKVAAEKAAAAKAAGKTPEEDAPADKPAARSTVWNPDAPDEPDNPDDRKSTLT